jgi:hypothetical protein
MTILPFIVGLLICLCFLLSGEISVNNLDTLIKDHYITVFTTILAINTASVANLLVHLKDIEIREHQGKEVYKKTRKEMYDNLKFCVVGLGIYFLLLATYPQTKMKVFYSLFSSPLSLEIVGAFLWFVVARALCLALFMYYLYATYEIAVKFTEAINGQKTNP